MHTVVIFGASGDLTSRKLIPALYGLYRKKRLPEGTRIVGFSRTAFSDDAVAQQARRRRRPSSPATNSPPKAGRTFAESVYLPARRYRQGGRLSRTRRATEELGARRRRFARSTIWPPRRSSTSRPSSIWARRVWPTKTRGKRRIVIEKPFGTDRHQRPRSERRRASSVSASRRSIASTITWAKRRCRTSWCCGSPTPSSSRSGTATTSTTCRSPWPKKCSSAAAAATTTRAGVLRDMFQNHLLQLLMITAMEAPVRYKADADPRRKGQSAAGDPAADRRATSRDTRSAANIAATSASRA